MQKTYQVHRERESLVAKLVENNERSIEVTYRTYSAQIWGSQVSVFRNGSEVSRRAALSDGKYLTTDSEGNTSLFGYLAAYDRLGPELRRQIPLDWHPVLGRWFAPKEK